jgi:hypothetical protein
MALDKLTSDMITAGAVNAAAIADGTVVAAEIAADAIDGTKIADDAINSEHYAAGSIDDAHLATGISASKLTGSLPALTLAGALTGADQIVTAVTLKDIGFTVNAIGGTGGGTQALDMNLGNWVTATVDTSANTFTFTDPTATGQGCSFFLELTNGGSQTVTWPGAVDWEGGTAPTLTTAGVDLLSFMTDDAGTLWHGVLISTDSK